VGTLGVTVQFSQAGLRKGDVYYITANGPGIGAYKTIELADNLPAALIAASDMLLELSIQKNIQVPQERVSSPPTLNWTDTQSGLNLNSGVDATDVTLTNNGVQFYVPVLSGPSTQVYIHYRAWEVANVNIVGSISDPTLVAGALGTITPDNPLAYAVNLAVENANGQPVNYLAVADPTVDADWTGALAILEGLQVSDLVVLTTDTTIQLAVKNHVVAQSNEVIGGWRNAWLGSVTTTLVPLITAATTTNQATALATLADDPTMAGTQYTYLVCTSGNAKFVTNGVRAGDTVRYLFTLDGFGNTIWTEFTVASVVNEDTLILALPGNGVAVGVAQKFEIWRNLTPAEVAHQVVTEGAVFANKYVRYVWPDLIETVDGQVPSYFLAAALAGMMAGIAPHQGVEGVTLTGFTGASRSISYFNNAQLNTLQAGGVFVVTQNGANVVIRNGLTTDQSVAQNAYEVVVRNDNAIQSVVRARIAAFFGIANLSPSGIAAMQSEAAAGLFVLQSNTFIQRIGTMIISSKITDIRASTVNPVQLIFQATIVRPFPVESLDLTLVF
jgi:hypothetical protein